MTLGFSAHCEVRAVSDSRNVLTFGKRQDSWTIHQRSETRTLFTFFYVLGVPGFYHAEV